MDVQTRIVCRIEYLRIMRGTSCGGNPGRNVGSTIAFSTKDDIEPFSEHYRINAREWTSCDEKSLWQPFSKFFKQVESIPAHGDHD